jgi:hypothetical protein
VSSIIHRHVAELISSRLSQTTNSRSAPARGLQSANSETLKETLPRIDGRISTNARQAQRELRSARAKAFSVRRRGSVANGIALSTGDFGSCLNFTLEVSAPWTSPLITGRDQLNGFVWSSCFAHLGAIVMIEPFVMTRTFWPDAKPSAASHFPFSRMLGTQHSFFRCAEPHCRCRLEMVSVRWRLDPS